MKKLLLLMLLAISSFSFAQSYSCSELVEYAKSEDSYPDTVTPIQSSMLTKIQYYSIDYNSGLVIAYIKSSEFDYRGKPYIFCGISSTRWSYFKSAGIAKSYGEAFHKYIMDYTCDCY